MQKSKSSPKGVAGLRGTWWLLLPVLAVGAGAVLHVWPAGYKTVRSVSAASPDSPVARESDHTGAPTQFESLPRASFSNPPPEAGDSLEGPAAGIEPSTIAPPDSVADAEESEISARCALVLSSQGLGGALAWAEKSSSDLHRYAAFQALAYEVAGTDAPEAMSLAWERLPPGPEREAAVLHAARQWAEMDPQRAVDWAVSLPDQPESDRLRAAVVIELAEADGAQAASLAARLLESNEEQARALVGIAQRWAQQDPAHAAAWVMQASPGAARDAAMRNLVATWAGSDTAAAHSWCKSLPDPVDREAALRAFAESYRARIGRAGRS